MKKRTFRDENRFGGRALMRQNWQYEIIKLLGTAVFLTAVFFAGRQAAVLVNGVVQTKEENQTQEQKIDDYSKMQKYCVVVDAGHGGDDPGKVGVNGALEKDINLTIAKRLAILLEQSDVKVILTRENDEGLNDAGASQKKVQDMKRRIAKMEEAKPDLVVSIHQNSYDGPSIRGAQVFYYTTSTEGKALADIIQNRMVQGLDPTNHRVAKANDSYYLLKKTSSPIVIVECGFLSNPEEAELLCDTVYQERVAWQVHMGILQYLHANVKAHPETLGEEEKHVACYCK